MNPFVYLLIAIYFIGLVLMSLFVLGHPDSARPAKQGQDVQAFSPIARKDLPAYGILAALFTFFLVLTVILQHDTGHHS